MGDCVGRRWVGGAVGTLLLGTTLVAGSAMAQERVDGAAGEAVEPSTDLFGDRTEGLSGTLPGLQGRRDGTGVAPGAGRRYVDAPALPFTPGGVRLGSSWILSSAASTSVIYDDNVNSAPSGEREDDVVANATLRGRLDSRLARHRFSVDGRVSGNLYTEETRPDALDWNVGGAAELDLTPRSRLLGSVRYQRDEVDRTDPETEALDLDERVNDVVTRVGYARSHRLWTARGNVNVARQTFSETDTRDRWRYGIDGTYSRRLSPNLWFDVSPSYEVNDFDDAATDRDSQRFQLTVGGRYRWPSGITLGAGISGVYIAFDDPDRDDRQGVDFDVDVTGGIRLGPATRLNVSALRTTNTTVTEDFSVRSTTALQAGLLHVFTPALTGALDVGVSRDDFDDGSRTDHNIDSRARLSYAFTDRIVSTLSYRFEKRFADDSADDFRRNLVSVGVTFFF